MKALYRFVPPLHHYPGTRRLCRKPVTVWATRDGVKTTFCRHLFYRQSGFEVHLLQPGVINGDASLRFEGWVQVAPEART